MAVFVKIVTILGLLLVAFGLLVMAYKLISGLKLSDMWIREKISYDITLDAELKD